MVHDQFRAYRATLQDDRRQLLERFEVVDMARKVVGVGSVGTRAFIVLLQGRDEQDPLVPAGQGGDRRRSWRTTCRRAATGSPASESCRASGMMQAASDIFLGWTKGVEADRYLYWRQLRDMKGSAVVETMAPGRRSRSTHASVAGRWRGRTPDRATRSRSPRTSARRTGSTSRSADFSERYADQNEQDYEAFCDAIRSGRLEAVAGI